MSADDVVKEVRRIMGKADCSERELYEALLDEAYGWEMRLEELDDDE